jgi:methyltransferase-like protein 6
MSYEPGLVQDDERAPKKRRLDKLGPAIVADYAPYSKQQLACGSQSALRNCAMQWDQYYKNNTLNGYKDRHYIFREFVELSAALQQLPVDDVVSLVEIGCGVGNAVLPLLAHTAENLARPDQFQVFGFDISQVAVNLLKQRATDLGFSGRLHCTQHDLAKEPVPSAFMPRPAPFGTMIFVLSSVPVADHEAFVSRIGALMAPGGVLLVRDYCAEDHAQTRFGPGKQVEDETGCTYARSNGTLSHFFTEDELRGLFSRHGFEPIEVRIVERLVENRKQHLTMERRWLNGRFRKKHTAASPS